MKLDAARKIALGLPETTEAPHHDMSSFRVKGKIFCTVPPDGHHLHIFVDEMDIHAAVAENPEWCELLPWGKRIAGVRVSLDHADRTRVSELLRDAWRFKAPPRVRADHAEV